MKTLILWTLLFQAQDDRELDKKKLLEKLAKGVDALLDLRDSSKRAWKDFTKFLDEKIGGFKKEAPAPKAEPAPRKSEPPKATEAESKRPFRYNSWEAWNSFKEGSSVEFEMETSGLKMRQTKTVDKKEADKVTLKTELVITVGDNETKTPGSEEVKKAAPMADGECPLCWKKFSQHKDEGKWSEETLKIAARDVKCHKYEAAAMNCKGDVNPKMTVWYSTDVPGHMVKMETDHMKMIALKFEKR